YDANGNQVEISEMFGDTRVGNMVKIQMDGKLYSPSQLDNSVGSNKAIANIAKYYAKAVGAENGTIVGTGATDEKSSENPAFTCNFDNVARINNNGGFSPALDDIDNFKSTMKHEILHQKNNINGVKSNFENHAEVYLKQMADPSFQNTTKNYKEQIIGSFGNYLLNMNREGYGQNAIDSKIETFNSLNLGYQISSNTMRYYPGTLKLTVQSANGSFSPNYTKLKN
ncbi:hypothetical protein, partial [Flavobacterium aurantiibacter]